MLWIKQNLVFLEHKGCDQFFVYLNYQYVFGGKKRPVFDMFSAEIF
jgi:hypothetical protein